MLDLQPISLTRLLDRLADNGLIERRPDPNDRRANRLYLTPAARPLLEQLAGLGQEMMEIVLGGLDERAQCAAAARSRASSRTTCARPSAATPRSRKPPTVSAS